MKHKKIYAGIFIAAAVISAVTFYNTAMNSIKQKIDFNNIKF